jgi:protein-tyrosine phosphatase
MIDLHCHILHGLDDGPKTAAESMQMALTFERAGYRTVAATPHMVPGTAWMPSTNRINTRVDQLNHALRNEGLTLEIVSGMEIALDPQIPDLLDQGHLLTLGNSSCLLVEPSFQQLPPGWEQIIFSILAKGHSILLAHPERCVQLAANLNLIERLIEAGVFLQVNWGSFLGQYGRTAMHTARKMAGSGWIHCLATDSHQPGGHAPERIGKATATLQKLIGQENLQRITTDNPLRLLNDKIPLPMKRTGAMTEKKKRWWQFW